MSQRLLGAVSLALVGPGCAATVSAGPDVASVAGHTVVGGRMTMGGGLGDATGSDTLDLRVPVALRLGKRTDDGEGTEAGLEFVQECSWGAGYFGGHAGLLIGVGLAGTSGTYVGIQGGPTLSLEEPAGNEWTPTLTLSGTAAAGVGGDVNEHGVFGLSLSFGYDLHGGGIRIPSGRPLRDRKGREWVPRVQATTEAGGASAFGLPNAIRQTIGEQWLGDAGAEYASIASFLRLALELRELKAPTPLIRRAYLAAHQELTHARACFALAASYLGFFASPEPLPAARPRPGLTLAALATECWLDGCLGEGFAARMARARSRWARVGRVRSVLEGIARDEAAHAELAWDILRFCRRHDTQGVGAALGAAQSPVSDASALNGPREVAAELAAHGVLPLQLQREQYLAITRVALQRAAREGLHVGQCR